MLFLKKMLLFFEKHWKLLLLVVSALFTILFLKGKNVNFINDYLKIKKVHDEKLKKIKEINQKEREQLDVNLHEYEKNVDKINQDFLNKQDALNKKKSNEATVLIDKGNNNINDLAKDVSNVTGFKVIVPKDET